ncbi:MAG: YggS family pyridoxal phosphate-dependent enzyme [Alphaproteobacteria bacterium]
MSIADNIAEIEAALDGRAKLVAVSKVQPDERIEEALAAGHRLYGENRVQEAHSRWSDRRAAHPDLTLHLIGPLQTNKAKQAVELFDVIETVDRPKLVKALAKAMAETGRNLDCYIQVNTGDEDQKAGVAPTDLPALLDTAITAGLNITGLMCIPPIDEEPAMHFGLLKKLATRHNLPNLSMGMSGDWQTALNFGATHLRIGTAVFGARDYA